MSDQSGSGPVMFQVIGVVLNSNDEPVGDLLLSGAAQVGEVLTVDASNVSDPNGLADATFEYQWVHIDGDTETDIGSATGTSYTLTAGDEGKRIRVKVTYTDDAGYEETLVSVPTQPVRPQDGIGIMVTNLYQESSGTTFADAEFPHLMQAFDTGDNADGYTLNGVRVGAIARDDGVNPVVSITEDYVFAGGSAPGRVVYTMATATAISTDKDNPSVNVDFAAGDVYLAPNTRYWVQFFYPSRDDGSFAVGVTPEDDEDFGAAPGWTIADFHVYTNSFDPASPLRYDHDIQLRIAVLGKAGAGNRLPEGQPAISGEAHVNKVLTADTSGITDGDGLTMATYTYQWFMVDGATDTNIRGSTSQTYTLTEDDLGKQFGIKVSFSDDRGYSATISSRATQSVRSESGDGIQVSNAGQDTDGLVGVTERFPLGAVSFTTGGHSGGYRLNSVRVAGIVNDDGATPKVSLYSDVSGVPGTVLHALTVPSGIPTGATANPAPAELTADTAVLSPHTTCWVVFERPASSDDFYLLFTDSTDDDFGAASGWSLGDELAFQRMGISNWLKDGLIGSRFLFQIAVKADLATVQGTPAFPASEDGTRSVDENTAAGDDIGAPVAAIDPDSGDTLTYRLTGADALAFDIVESSGQLRTKAALNYESKSSYSVTVSVRDGKDANGAADAATDDTIDMTINIGNVDEAGVVSFSKVGAAIRATLSDPDGGMNGVTWEWSRSSDRRTGWTNIGSATLSLYTPSGSDQEMYLRATASYTDAQGAGKSAQGVSSSQIAPPNLQVATLVSGLTIPWDMAFTLDGTMLFTQRGGVLSSRLANGVVQTVDADFGDLLASGETGLMGIVVDPSFASNRRFYTCQGHTGPEVQVIAWTINPVYTEATRVADPLVGGIPASSGRHGGCRLRFGPEGYLWIATGDAATGTVPQDLTSLGGKVLRVDASTGAGVPANPFTSSPLVYTYGHRNVQGLALRPGTSQMWSVEHGPSVDDEINLLAAGGNYGWNPVPGYNEGVPMTDIAEFPGAIESKWSSGSPTLAASGAIFLEGDQWGVWEGWLAVATLKDQKLRVFEFDTDGALVSQAVVPVLNGAFSRLRTRW